MASQEYEKVLISIRFAGGLAKKVHRWAPVQQDKSDPNPSFQTATVIAAMSGANSMISAIALRNAARDI
jgi:hypothetical protein